MKPLVFILVIVVAIGFLGLATLPLFTPSANDRGPSSDVQIQNQFPGKVVYTTDTEQDVAPYQADCGARGGEFNECGTTCAPDAEVCAQVCAYTCEIAAQKEEISINQPQPNQLIGSPLTITGEAPGGWYLEGSFSVYLLGPSDREIANTPAQAQGEWMTTDPVPFQATLEFEAPVNTSSGTLVFREAGAKDGEGEGLEEYRMPVRFGHQNLIRVSQPSAGATVTSPLTISGEARGPWYFEASFSVRLLDGNGNEVPLTPPYVMAEGEWMTTDFVPFEAALEFEAPNTPTGTLILEKANPSGLPEHADEIRIPVRFDE